MWVVVVNGELETDEDARALEVLARTYWGVVGHGFIPNAETRGGSDWWACRLPAEYAAGMVDVIQTMARSWWHWEVQDSEYPDPIGVLHRVYGGSV